MLASVQVFQLSPKTVTDEWYYFGEDIAPLKVPSPQLVDESDGAAAPSTAATTTRPATSTAVVRGPVSSSAAPTSSASVSTVQRLAGVGLAVSTKTVSFLGNSELY